MAIDTIRTWSIGDVEITRIVEVNNWEDDITMLLPDATPETVLAYPWLQPHYATASGKMIISFQCFVMRTPQHQIMLDTCIGADRQREFDVFTNLRTDFLDDLGHAGFDPKKIDTVLCTHLHFDHVGWNTRLVDGRWVPTFPNARYLFGRSEYEHWKMLTDTNGYHDLNHMHDAVQPVVDAGLVDLIEIDHAICPEITLRPTPGHTPGHVSIAIESRGERAIVTGDLMHNPIQLERPDDTVRFDMDQARARRTRMQFVDDMANTDVFVIGSHFSDPTGGWVVRDAAGCRLAQRPLSKKP
ncbi:MAG TPA: MBL fold metallo-hydrolase [Gammaproteobacteria bacterium]|nr:MBL fold metallo-hydrolase [Gammaproteobacteria bacterium]